MSGSVRSGHARSGPARLALTEQGRTKQGRVSPVRFGSARSGSVRSGLARHVRTDQDSGSIWFGSVMPGPALHARSCPGTTGQGRAWPEQSCSARLGLVRSADPGRGSIHHAPDSIHHATNIMQQAACSMQHTPCSMLLAAACRLGWANFAHKGSHFRT